MLDHEGGIGLKRRGKLENLEEEEGRKIKNKCAEILTSDALVPTETAVAARQHPRKP